MSTTGHEEAYGRRQKLRFSDALDGCVTSLWLPTSEPGERTHRIPGGQHDRFFFEGGMEGPWQIAPACGDFEQILVEPRVVHEVEAFLAVVLSPGILDAPAPRCTVDDVDTGEQHGVRHLRLAVYQALRLGEREGRVVDTFIIKHLGIPEAGVAAHHLPHIT